MGGARTAPAPGTPDRPGQGAGETRARPEPGATTAELARHLDIDQDDVIEGLYAGNGYSADSLDAPPEDGDAHSAGGTLAAFLGAEDPALEKAENVQALKPLLDGLEERERRILYLRFGAELTQTEIGKALGISQMQVSRLLTRILAGLREKMLEEN